MAKPLAQTFQPEHGMRIPDEPHCGGKRDCGQRDQQPGAKLGEMRDEGHRPVGIGAAAGLLLAPKSGKQLRRDLQRSYDDVFETISEWSDEARERLKEALEKGSDFAEELRAKAQPIGDFLKR